MKSIKLLNAVAVTLAIASTTVLSACRDEGATIFHPGPTAYVRFLNAVTDSGGQDWRFVDFVEGSPTALNVTFRGIFPGAAYQAATPGVRHLRVFQSALDLTFGDPNKASPGIVSTVFIDSTFNLEAGKHYSIVAVGSLRAGTAKFLILKDDFADPGTSVGVRVVNLGLGTVDVYGGATGGTDPLPSTALVAGLAQYGASQWVSLATGALTLRALAAGSTTLPALLSVTAPAGKAADQNLNLTAVGGSTIAGSAFTAFLFPAAVAGSPAAATVSGTCPTKCATAGVVYAVDKYPPSGF